MPSLRAAIQAVFATRASMPAVEIMQPYLWLPGAEISILFIITLYSKSSMHHCNDGVYYEHRLSHEQHTY